MLESLQKFWEFVVNTIITIRIIDIIDIIIVTVIFYNIFKFFKNTKSTQLLKGILIIFVCLAISKIVGLKTLNYILSSTLQFGALALIVLFQPELRKLLEQFGSHRFKWMSFSTDIKGQEFTPDNVDQITKAVFNLASTKTGALIAIERSTYLKEITDTGTYVNSECAQLLLENIFFHNSPLHDGGVVISKGKIVAAACLFPLSDNKEIAAELGTRHRAGIGLSEATDAIIIVVSEETGAVSVAVNGSIKRNFTSDSFYDFLAGELLPAGVKKEKRLFGKARNKK